ncbi:MAG: DsrE family protein [Ignavibacteriae bacterium]|nr:DsrE family protein [Ignavibacteriota bacterium]
MNILLLINDAPYGTEKAYNAFRLAMALQKDHPTVQVNVFLMADAVGCAISNQTTPQGYYNIERMVKSVISKSGKIKACGSCADARGIRSLQLVEGVEISNMAELAQWTVEADKVFTF